MNAITRVIPALAAIGLMVPAAIAVGGQPPQGRPLLPDLDQEAPAQLMITKTRTVGWRLGFQSAVSNVGDGPLIIDGRRLGPAQPTMDADQMIMRSDGSRSVVRRVGNLRYVRSPDHRHWHLLRFDRYELRRPRGAKVVVRDRKSGFCLGDRYDLDPVPAAKAPAKVYTSRCGLERPGLTAVREGISVGYGDNYVANLEGQYLPLDGLRPGRYVLVHEVNADHRLAETSYANNASSALLRLRWRRGVPQITILSVCSTGARCPAAR
jgi:hypothetical protein